MQAPAALPMPLAWAVLLLCGGLTITIAAAPSTPLRMSAPLSLSLKAQPWSQSQPLLVAISELSIGGQELGEGDRTSAPFIDADGSWPPVFRWALVCPSGFCYSVRQTAYQLNITRHHLSTSGDANAAVRAQSTFYHGPWHSLSSSQHALNSTAAALLSSDALYSVELAVSHRGTQQADNSGFEATALARGWFRTALLADTDWEGVWLGGGTQMRTTFTLPKGRGAIASATAYASGVGCFSLELNGAPQSDFMDPGWAVLPSKRVLYRAYDVAMHTLAAPAVNAIGVRLGMCKYGKTGLM